MPRVYQSPDSSRSSARIRRGKSTSGTRNYTRTNGRITAFQGTPVPPSKNPNQASRRARRVEGALRRVRKAYKSTSSSPSLDAEQNAVLRTVLKQGEKLDATKREKLAAVETGLVESNLRNLQYGDADSQGWRQERTSQYGDGPKGANNVKASARRFFQEIKTEGAGAATPGLAAQGAQGSAFPERYDQQEGKARQLMREVSRPKVKPKPKDTKLLKRAGVKSKPAAPPKPEKRPGPWAGSQKAVLSVVPKSIRAEGRGDKRTPSENSSVGGSPTSDHLTTNQKSYAADLPPDDAAARQIANRLGMASHVGTNEAVKDGYKYQLIWQTDGHYDHIHLGAEWVGEGVPPGTTLGGPSGSTGSLVSGSSDSSGGTTSSAKSSPSGVTKKQKLARIRAAYSDAETEPSLADLERRYSAVV